MKKILLIIIVLCLNQIIHAQLSIVLNVQANPTAIISSWASSPQVVTLLVNNPIPQQRAYKIKTTIKTTSGEIVAVSDLTKVLVQISIGGSSASFNTSTVVPLEFMFFNGIYKTYLQKSGKLPTATYQICVQLVNPIDYAIITQEQCKVFNIAVLQLPYLVGPAPQSTLDKNIAQSVITFRWTPVVPKPSQQLVTYRLQVFEVLEGQKPMQAFRANMPLLDQSIKGQTQYIWRPLLTYNDAIDSSKVQDTTAKIKDEIVKTFIWTIQSFTQDGVTGSEIPITDGSINGDGRSEPAVFYVSKKIVFPPHAINDKIVFPPNAVASSVLDKITFPPNCLAIFCPNGTIGVDGKCVPISIPLQANATISDGIFDGKKQLLDEKEIETNLLYTKTKGATYVGTVIKTIEDKQYLISMYNNNKIVETVVVPLVNENGFLKMTNTATIISETNGQKVIFTKEKTIKNKRSQENKEQHYVGHVTLLR